MTASPARKTTGRETMATQRTALQAQIEKLSEALAVAQAASNRAVAEASIDGSKEATARRTDMLGKVARADAELTAARNSHAQIEADIVALDERRRVQVEHAKLRAAAAAVRRLAVLAAEADAGAAAFADSYKALMAETGKLYSTVPDSLKEAVFGGGSNLGAKALHSTATFLLSKSDVVPRPLYAPTEFRQKLTTLIETFCKLVLDAAAALPDPEPDWD